VVATAAVPMRKSRRFHVTLQGGAYARTRRTARVRPCARATAGCSIHPGAMHRLSRWIAGVPGSPSSQAAASSQSAAAAQSAPRTIDFARDINPSSKILLQVPRSRARRRVCATFAGSDPSGATKDRSSIRTWRRL
jgi:hypothetical protein